MNNSDKSFRKFFLLWSGELISAIGSGLTSFVLGVYVFQQTGKASVMALVTLLAFMPSLLLGPIAGVLADRYDRRLLMILGDSLSAIGLVFILICMLGGKAQLWQICVGVTISSVFSSLLEPTYKATITDLLTEEQFIKASGLVQAAGSAKYLISPAIAGFLLTVSDIKLLLLLDICTLFVTVASTLAVRRGLASKKYQQAKSFIREFRDGWGAVAKNRGVLVLVIITSVMTFFLGFIQTLFTPMILAFTDTILDFLIRTNIENDLHGGAWGLIGVLSQFGFVAAYALSGVLADHVFTPMLLDGGVFADTLGKIIGTGSGRGTGFLILIAGLMLCMTSIILYNIKSVKKLENRGDLCISK